MTQPMTDLPSAPLTVLRAVALADEVLTEEALGFVAALQAQFGLRRHALLVARGKRSARIQAEGAMEYNPETEALRRGIWQAAPAPEALTDRRVELIAPADDLAPALASGAPIVIADFEDTASPSFARMIAGQASLRDHSREAIVMMRPRALHSAEGNVIEAGAPISAALFDLGLYLFHNAKGLAEAGRGPFLYIPKIDSADEARFWCDVLGAAEERLGLAPGTIKVTAMIETLSAAFAMDEIIEAFGPHIIGMSFGADDLVADYLEKFQSRAGAPLPDRDQIAQDEAFLASIAAQLVKVCHRRGLHAIGGMYAGTDEAEMRAAMQRVIGDGHDGAWVMDPGQLRPAREVWQASLPEPNQIRTPRQHYRIDPEAMIRPHEGGRSAAGLRGNIALAMEYLSGWLQGRGTTVFEGCVVDTATAEIARRQLRQWLVLGCEIDGPEGAFTLTEARLGQEVQAHIGALLEAQGPGGFHRGHYASAARILIEAVSTDLPHLTEAAGPVLQALDH